MYVPSRQYDSQSGTKFYDYSNDSPYDNFMRKHLQHYGYYTGKNDKRIKSLDNWQEPDQAQPNYKEYGFEDDYMNEALNAKDRPDKELSSNQVVYNVNDGKLITKLKEPRALFSIAPDSGFHPPKWPIELEVLPERVTHIDDFPGPEAFNHPTGFEPISTILGEEGGGRLVFCYEPILSPFFIKSRLGGSKSLTEVQARLESETDDTLVFESRFESGNLRKVYQVAPTEYELWLRTDLYTSKHTQWFYFRVSNTRPGQLYRFTLVNFYKSASLYNEGLRPLMYSEKSASVKGVGWRRCGGNIKYFRSNKRYSTQSGDKYYYSLTWQIRFEHAEDTVYFAHCYPYTYSDLVDYLQKLQDDPVKSQFCKQRVLCRSLAGNAVHLLTIGTSGPAPAVMQQVDSDSLDAALQTLGAGNTNARTNGASAAPAKRVILVTSRVHPGESNASWMMKGFLDFLTGDSADARLLRDCFTFKVVPMINPDGVIVGNYRCSLTGRDLNRNYKTVLKESFPAVHAIVELVKKLQATREVALYCDLHGHSRRQNVFIYGCTDQDAKDKDRLLERLFPAMMSKNAPDKFSYELCKFKMQKSKEGTGRIVMYNLGVRNSFTMEATFCGSSLGGLKGHHFHYRHLEEIGAQFCDTLLDYFDPNPAKRDNMLLQVERKLKAQILINLQRSGRCPGVVNVDELSLSELSDEEAESSDGGSDSSASNGLPVHYEFLKSQAALQERKKKRRSRKERAGANATGKKPAKPPHADCVPTGDAAASQLERRSAPTGGARRSLFCDRCGNANCPQNAAAGARQSKTLAKPAASLSAPTKTGGAAATAAVENTATSSGGSPLAAAATLLATRSASSMAVKQGRSSGAAGPEKARLKSVASDPNMQPVAQGAAASPDQQLSQGIATAAAAGDSGSERHMLPMYVKHQQHQLADFDRLSGQHLLPGATRLLPPNDASDLLRIYSYQRSNAVAHNYTLETIEYMLAARETESQQQQQQQQQQLLQRRSASTNQVGGSPTVSMAQAGHLLGLQMEPLQTPGASRLLVASQRLQELRIRRQLLPNRRMHSASPSYPSHSVPVQIAPEERQAYQLEWTLSQQQQQHSDHPAATWEPSVSEIASSSNKPSSTHSSQNAQKVTKLGLGEIAQTLSQPTLTLSSGSKPPIAPSLSQQSRPAMINLHITASSAVSSQQLQQQQQHVASTAIRKSSLPGGKTLLSKRH